jgi:hypothetical protein
LSVIAMEVIQIIASCALDFKLKFPDLVLSPCQHKLHIKPKWSSTLRLTILCFLFNKAS